MSSKYKQKKKKKSAPRLLDSVLGHKEMCFYSRIWLESVPGVRWVSPGIATGQGSMMVSWICSY